MWKQMNLQCPADDFCEYNADDQLLKNGLQKFVGLLTSSAEILTKDHPLWAEIKVLQNVQAKYRRILHCDKCLQLLQKVGTYLRKMVLLNLSKSYLDLAEPFLKELQSQDNIKLLPSQQQFDYVLIRTQSAAKLICEALHYSRETFCYLIQRLKIGHLVVSLMMATSVTARVNILFRGILIQITQLYQKVYKWRKKLKVGKWEWPQPLDLPNNLEEWLNQESDPYEPKELPTEQLSFLKNVMENQKDKNSVVDVDMEDDDDECMIIADTTQQNENMDIGEVIPREENDVTSTTQEENLLFEQINKSKSYKKLYNIWENIEEWQAQGALLQPPDPEVVKKINKMFTRFLRELNEVKDMRLTDEERKNQNKQIKKKYRLKFSKFLRPLTEPAVINSSASESHTEASLQPVKTYNELLSLYEALYTKLETVKATKKCSKLKKMFKSRKSDIKLLIENNEKPLAKQLIFCTSKILITKYSI